MNCIPLLARKKRNLRSNNRGSGYSLRFELGCGAGKNLASSAILLGTCSTSQTLLQWCFSCLWHFVLRCSLWNANWQTGNLFGRSGQRRFTSLFETAGTQVKVLFKKNAILGEEHSTLCILLQSSPTDETHFPEILFSPGRFHLSSLLGALQAGVWPWVLYNYGRYEILPNNKNFLARFIHPMDHSGIVLPLAVGDTAHGYG